MWMTMCTLRSEYVSVNPVTFSVFNLMNDKEMEWCSVKQL